MRGKATIAAALGLTLTLSAAKPDPFAGRVAGHRRNASTPVRPCRGR